MEEARKIKVEREINMGRRSGTEEEARRGEKREEARDACEKTSVQYGLRFSVGTSRGSRLKC